MVSVISGKGKGEEDGQCLDPLFASEYVQALKSQAMEQSDNKL